MLTNLRISNYALIENLEIEIKDGLSVITGETGAGKSIIMGALALIAGQRSDTKVISKGAKKCIIEAQFLIENYNLEEIFKEIDVDYENCVIIRREINDNGKSRAFINDTPCSLANLKLLLSNLIDIHSQHANLLLNDIKFQINILDSYANSQNELFAYQSALNDYLHVKKQLDELIIHSQDLKQEKDYIEFQYNQLSDAKLILGEQEELEAENIKLEHSEEIKTELYSAIALLNGDSYGIVTHIKETTNSLRRISDYLDQGEIYLNRLESILIDTKDIVAEFESISDTLDFDPKRKNYVEERLDTIYSLQQKHKVDNIDALITIQDQYTKKLNNILYLDDDIENLKNIVEQKKAILDENANLLTNKRLSVLDNIELAMTSNLVFLGINNAKFKIEINSSEKYLNNGKDEVVFKFSANKNIDLQPVTSIASGGEMSRVMLCLKSLIATKKVLHTIIFDEIDTGVSGEVANKMGRMMKEIAENMQVITITHLPQIASKGHNHLMVYKEDIEDRTISKIVELNFEQRVTQIAEMLSGKNLTPQAIDAAKQLLL